MQTILTYRFPGEPVIEKTGIFRKLDNPGLFEGFIVSDFEGVNFYGFSEGESGEAKSAIEPPVVIGKSAYCDMAREFIYHLQVHNIGKAVLSRVKYAEFDEGQRLELFRKLTEKFPRAFCYSFDSPLLGKWIGATPETLIRIEAGRGETMSLAGTKPVSDTTSWGEKEAHEQQLVTDFLYRELSSTCRDVQISEREELIAGPVKHLVNHFRFTIDMNDQWPLIQAIHPTPAVSGFPRPAALECIARFEPHNRRFYAGIIGKISSSETNLFVNLRSAQILNNGLYVYAGGGLTQQSDPESEWEETENKSKTILDLV